MTDKEAEFLEMFRKLDRHEQRIIIGKVSELMLNKKKRETLFFLG